MDREELMLEIARFRDICSGLVSAEEIDDIRKSCEYILSIEDYVNNEQPVEGDYIPDLEYPQ